MSPLKHERTIYRKFKPGQLVSQVSTACLRRSEAPASRRQARPFGDLRGATGATVPLKPAEETGKAIVWGR